MDCIIWAEWTGRTSAAVAEMVPTSAAVAETVPVAFDVEALKNLKMPPITRKRGCPKGAELTAIGVPKRWSANKVFMSFVFRLVNSSINYVVLMTTP